MAHILHVTFLDDTKPTQTFRVKPDYFACIVTRNDQPHLAVTQDNGATEYIPANSVASTWLQKKRDTPARDHKVAMVREREADYTAALNTAAMNFGIATDAIPAFEDTLLVLLDHRAELRKAKDELAAHDAAMAKARKPKTTDATPAPKKSRKKKSA